MFVLVEMLSGPPVYSYAERRYILLFLWPFTADHTKKQIPELRPFPAQVLGSSPSPTASLTITELSSTLFR